MKKLNVVLFFILILLFFQTGEVIAADVTDTMVVHMSVDSMATLNVNPGTDITLTVSAPAIAGDTPADIINDANYLQYTATVTALGTKKITTQLSAAVLTGCSLKLQATVGSGTNEGTSAGQVTLSNESASNIITDIKTCATGTGSTDGAKLTYTLTVDTMTSLVVEEEKHLSVIFTLTDVS